MFDKSTFSIAKLFFHFANVNIQCDYGNRKYCSDLLSDNDAA